MLPRIDPRTPDAILAVAVWEEWCCGLGIAGARLLKKGARDATDWVAGAAATKVYFRV